MSLLKTKARTLALIAVKSPPIRILPSGCMATDFTSPLMAAVAKLSSTEPSTLSRASPLTGVLPTVWNTPPMMALPSAWIASVVGEPLGSGL